MTLLFVWQMSKGMISWSVKGFFRYLILAKLLLAKKLPKLGIQIPNAGDENQSCLIWTVIFNQIDWVRVPQYNLYSCTLFYTNLSISTSLWGCAPKWIWYDVEILKKTCYHVRRFICRFLLLEMHKNKDQMPGTTADRKKKKIWLILKGGTSDCWHFVIFHSFCREPTMKDEYKPFLPKS